MVERCLKGNFRIVQAVGLELHFGSAGASAEEIYRATLADHVDRPLPGFGVADRLNHDIATALLRREGANGVDHICDLRRLDDLVSAHLTRRFDLAVTLHDRNHVATDRPRHLHEHQSDGTSADNYHRVPDLNPGLVEAAQHTRQRFGHRGIFKAHIGRNHQHVGFDDALGDANVFGVSAVVEQQVFAEVFLMLGAIEAHLAGRRVQSDDAHAFLESVDPGAHLFDHSGQFVSEQCGRNDHAGVIAALVDLEVGPTGQGDLDLYENLAIANARDRDLFDL